jgi:hypothetical protein
MTGHLSSQLSHPKVARTAMDKKKAVDDTEPGPSPSRAVDRFGFIKPEQSNNSPEGISKSRSLHERERYGMSFSFLIYYLLLSFDCSGKMRITSAA